LGRPPATISPRFRGDELYFTAYPEETGGAYLLLEMRIAPGGRRRYW
jgi:hypothetical protein